MSGPLSCQASQQPLGVDGLSPTSRRTGWRQPPTCRKTGWRQRSETQDRDGMKNYLRAFQLIPRFKKLTLGGKKPEVLKKLKNCLTEIRETCMLPDSTHSPVSCRTEHGSYCLTCAAVHPEPIEEEEEIVPPQAARSRPCSRARRTDC